MGEIRESNSFEEVPEVKPEPIKEDLGLYSAEIERSKKRLGRLFESHPDGNERVRKFLSGLEHLLESESIDGDKIRKEIQNLSTEDNKEEFIEGVMSALKPLIDLSKSNPKDFEALQREALSKRNHQINEILFYDIEGSEISIHLAPTKTLDPIKIKSLVMNGLKSLAKTVEENKEIELVIASSWIVFNSPKLIELLGFTITEMNSETAEGSAVISRENFLNKYLNK